MWRGKDVGIEGERQGTHRAKAFLSSDESREQENDSY